MVGVAHETADDFHQLVGALRVQGVDEAGVQFVPFAFVHAVLTGEQPVSFVLSLLESRRDTLQASNNHVLRVFSLDAFARKPPAGYSRILPEISSDK